MSVRMRTHPINSCKNAVLYMTYHNKAYAIPEKIANKYLINEKADKKSISSQQVFANLEKKLTKAGALLKGLRIREGLSQIVFAEKIGITQANLSKMENGHRPIGKIVAKRIEKAFDVDYQYFLA